MTGARSGVMTKLQRVFKRDRLNMCTCARFSDEKGVTVVGSDNLMGRFQEVFPKSRT